MPARRIKTLFVNPNERNHREHRSKRGRSPNQRFERYARIRKALRLKRLEKGIYQRLNYAIEEEIIEKD